MITVPQQSLFPPVIIIEIVKLPLEALKLCYTLFGVSAVELCVILMTTVSLSQTVNRFPMGANSGITN